MSAGMMNAMCEGIALSMRVAARCAWLWVLLVLWASTATRVTAEQPQRALVVEQSLEAAPAYLMVHVQLWEGDRLLEGKASGLAAIRGLEDLKDLDRVLDGNGEVMEQSFTAFLDTGASGHVLSLATVQRFNIQLDDAAVYHETGLHGDVAMGVTQPYSLALAPTTGKLFDAPTQFGMAGEQVRFLVNRATPNALIAMAMGEINVIGMPAIRHLVVEIDPSPMGRVNDKVDRAIDDLRDIEGLEGLELLKHLDQVGVGPAVRLYDGRYQVAKFDFVVPLKLVDFSRHANPADRGAKPDLSANFVVEGVTIAQGEAVSQGAWLLDTGAPASIISTAQAKAIGLFTAEGTPARAPDFTLPLGGIGGEVTPVPGFRIDVLRLPLADGRVIEYRGAHVLVKDIRTRLDSGEVVTLDGVMGTNLLLPTVAGLGGLGLPSRVADGPFRRIWIDAPRSRLLLEK